MNAIQHRLATLPRVIPEWVVATLIGIGALIVLIAEAGWIIYSSGIYVVGENLLIVGSIASLVLVVSTSLRNSKPDGEAPRGVSLRTSAALGVGSFGGAALLLTRQGGFNVYSVAIGLLIALSLFIALNADSTAETLEAQDWRIGFRSIAIGIAVLLALTWALRLLASPSDLLTYVLAPVAVFILPGLALTLASQDEDTPVYVHIALIPVLSIASQLIVVAWLLWLRVPVTPLAMLIGCAAITVGGLVVGVIAKRRARRTID